MIHLDDVQVSALLPAVTDQVALMRETLLALADGSTRATMDAAELTAQRTAGV